MEHACAISAVKELYGQKPAWSEEDKETLLGIEQCIYDNIANIGTVNKVRYVDWLKSLKERVQPQSKQEWKQENTSDLTDFENAMMHIGDSFFGQHAGLDPNNTNAIKEQANLLLELIPSKEWSEKDNRLLNDAISLADECDDFELRDWLKSLKDRVQIQPMQEWSEENSIRLQRIIDFLWYNRKGDTDTIYQQEQDIEWLKSLRPQNRWKPSDEQMSLLEELVEDNNQRYFYTILRSLYQDLKKLK